MDALLLVSTALILVTARFLALATSIHFQNRKALLGLRAAQRLANSNIQKSRMELMETRNRARLLEDTVKHGTSAVEKMHQAIATTTFSLIDHFSTDQEFRESARRARETHNKTSRQIYQAARTTNKALHLLADSLFISRKEKKLTMRTRLKNSSNPPDEK
ncbi:hypothetical protein [Marinobacter confluentis]|uniref:Uncharacterized protein n=1 Tax=Marinobacter confluentis TaxID=1697557 RepID=A0A4Z1BFZ1_9GAMM|nr:hypothetical protein [Marinobacter confluentis]TGN41654.1 hypothetical protein E5Q11_03750 [Marinobacter confluentis]